MKERKNNYVLFSYLILVISSAASHSMKALLNYVSHIDYNRVLPPHRMKQIVIFAVDFFYTL